MFKKLLKTAAVLSGTAAAMLISSVTASAVTYKAEKTADGKTYQLTSIILDYEDENVTTVKLPTKVDGHTVTKIGSNVLDDNYWWYNDKLSKLVIPEGYTDIGAEAFANTPFAEAELPSTVKTVGKGAFRSCWKLNTVKLGGNETSLGESAFSDCSALTDIDLGQSLKTIGASCFSSSGLTTAVIPKSVTSLGKEAFSYCPNLESVYLFSSAAVPESCFSDCGSLKTVELGNTKTIGKYAFYWCGSLETVRIPAAVTGIGEDAFLYTYPTVYAPKGSAAEKYCEENYLTCENRSFTPFTGCTFTVTLPDLTFTGNAKTADITVKYGGNVLTEGTDYKVFYSHNTEVGKGAVMIMGLDGYAGTYYKTMDIKALDLTNSKVKVETACPSYMYRGRGIKPSVTVTYNGEKVVSSAYSLSFANNVYPGTATITVSGKDSRVTGSAKKQFKVTNLDLSDSNVKINIPCSSYMYRARGIKPTVTVKLGSAVIPAADYTVTITNNVEPGTAYIRVRAKGKYVTGSRMRPFTVTKLDVSKCKASIPYASYTYSGSAIRPAVTLKVGSTAIPAKHYSVSYNNNVNVGTATITVTAKGSKAVGILNRTFTVKPGKVKPAKIATKGTKATVTWKTAAQADGYEIWFANWYQEKWGSKPVYYAENLTKTITSPRTLSYSFTLSDSNKYYAVGIRSYKTVNGRKVYGDYTYTAPAESLVARVNGSSKSSKRTAYTEINTQGSKDIKQSHTLSQKSIAAIEAFAKKNFTSDMSDGEKIKKTVDYIRANFKYNYGFQTYYKNYVGWAYANNALVVHSGQCNDYNGAVCEMLNYLGYDARLIIGYYGRQGNQHYWTEVTLGGKVYVIECGITGYWETDSNGKSVYNTYVNFPNDCTTYERSPQFIRNSHAA